MLSLVGQQGLTRGPAVLSCAVNYWNQCSQGGEILVDSRLMLLCDDPGVLAYRLVVNEQKTVTFAANRGHTITSGNPRHYSQEK